MAWFNREKKKEITQPINEKAAQPTESQETIQPYKVYEVVGEIPLLDESGIQLETEAEVITLTVTYKTLTNETITTTSVFNPHVFSATRSFYEYQNVKIRQEEVCTVVTGNARIIHNNEINELTRSAKPAQFGIYSQVIDGETEFFCGMFMNAKTESTKVRIPLFKITQEQLKVSDKYRTIEEFQQDFRRSLPSLFDRIPDTYHPFDEPT